MSNFTPGPSINSHALQPHREHLLSQSLFCQCRSGWCFNTFTTGYFIISVWIFWFLMKHIYKCIHFVVVFVNYLAVFLLGSLSPSCWFIWTFYSNPLSWIVPVFFTVCLLFRLVCGVCFFTRCSWGQLEGGLVAVQTLVQQVLCGAWGSPFLSCSLALLPLPVLDAMFQGEV